MATRLLALVDRLPGKNVVLVGDFMLDRYVYGNAERLSPEAPVPVLHFQHDEFRLGGAGSVAADLAVLGANVRIVGLAGQDAMGDELSRLLVGHNCDVAGLLRTPSRPTTCKTRLVGLAQHRHPQQMLRLDHENAAPVEHELAAQVIAKAEVAMRGADVLCLEDYNKGVFADHLTREIIALARSKGIPVLIDPAAIREYGKYAGATCIKLNRTETEKATGLVLRGETDYAAAADKLLSDLNLESVVITLDKNGAYLGTREGERHWLKTRPRQVYDVTGAGDMVLATLALARAAGGTWAESVALANIAGGLEVEKFGAVPIMRSEIVAEILAETHSQLGKLRDDPALLAELARHREAGKTIVFTNGCFDIIHLGHVEYFRFAKRQGDLLVVAVNTDASIRKLKGEKRPVVNEDDRVSVLSELESIDYLVKFADDTPARLIEAIRPDVLVKGADYRKEQVVGWDVVESYGGRVELAPLIEGRSTSNLIGKILDAYKA